MKKTCMKCGGSMKPKMAKGGVTKPFAAGIPYAVGAGQTDGKNGMMKKGGMVKKQDGGKVGSYDEILKRKVKKNLAGSTVTKQTSRSYDPKSEEMSVTKTKTVTPKNAKAGDTVRQKSKSKIILSQKVLDNQKVGGSVKKMAKGGATSFGMLSVKAGVDNNPKPTAADRIAGAKKKAKFGASVPVQHSPAPGRVRSSSGVGTVPVGARKKMGGSIKKKK